MKHPVILDACTIIHLLCIDEDEFLFKSIKSLDLHIANIVYQEVCRNVNKKSLPDEQKKYIEQTTPSLLSFSRQTENIIKDISEDYFKNLCDFTEHKKKHNGELLSTALSLCVSREKNSKVYFYTDDFPARNQFSNYFEYQQIGVIGDSVDLLLFLHWTNSDFDEKHLKKHLQDLKSECNTSLKEFVNKIQKKKEKFTIKEKKDKNLIQNIDKILNGYYLEFDALSINKSITFFNSSKKYTAIKEIIKQFPDIDKECWLSKKIINTMELLSSHSIFKIA